jgi:hypothetical protein
MVARQPVPQEPPKHTPTKDSVIVASLVEKMEQHQQQHQQRGTSSLSSVPPSSSNSFPLKDQSDLARGSMTAAGSVSGYSASPQAFRERWKQRSPMLDPRAAGAAGAGSGSLLKAREDGGRQASPLVAGPGDSAGGDGEEGRRWQFDSSGFVAPLVRSDLSTEKGRRGRERDWERERTDAGASEGNGGSAQRRWNAEVLPSRAATERGEVISQMTAADVRYC